MNDKQQSDQHRHHEREARQTFMISSPDEPERIGKSFHRSIRAPSGDCHVGQMDYGRGVSLREVRWHYFRTVGNVYRIICDPIILFLEACVLDCSLIARIDTKDGLSLCKALVESGRENDGTPVQYE